MNQEQKATMAKRYRDALLEDVVPFWMKHAPDYKNGGYYHCLDRDGSVINTQKSLWIEARAVWMFSRLYNSPEFSTRSERGEWLKLAKLGADFLKKFGRDANGDYYFCLSAEGKPTVAPYNVFSDCFAAMGFIEYGKAANDAESIQLGKDAYQRIQARKNNPKGKWTKAMPDTMPLLGMSLPMINVNMGEIFNALDPSPEYEKQIRADINMLLDQFVDREHKVIRENILVGGGFDNSTYEGRHINAGHGIETLWFIMQVAARWNDQAIIKRCHEALLWNLEFGWDKEFGGIFYFQDVQNKPHIELSWDMKLWWVHLESLIATLMGYQLTGDEKLWDWFVKLDDYTWSRFPDPKYGEWFAYLNREGKVNNYLKGSRWKCFFHLPRALQIIAQLLEKVKYAQNG